MELEIHQVERDLQMAIRQAQLSEIATNVLLEMGKLLGKGVNVSASLVSDQVKELKIANVVRVGILIREHAADW